MKDVGDFGATSNYQPTIRTENHDSCQGYSLENKKYAKVTVQRKAVPPSLYFWLKSCDRSAGPILLHHSRLLAICRIIYERSSYDKFTVKTKKAKKKKKKNRNFC